MDQQGQTTNPQQPASGGTTPPPQPEAGQPMAEAPAAAATAATTAPDATAPVSTPTPEGTAPVPATPLPSQQPPAGAAPAPKKSFAKMLIIIFVLLIVGLGGFLAWQMYANNATDQAMLEQAPSISPTEAVMISPSVAPVASGDADLDNQSTVIDESMEKVDEDVTEVNNGLQDTPADLSQ